MKCEAGDRHGGAVQIPRPELGPLEGRVEAQYEEAIFTNDISSEDTEYWFTEPEGAPPPRPPPAASAAASWQRRRTASGSLLLGPQSSGQRCCRLPLTPSPCAARPATFLPIK